MRTPAPLWPAPHTMERAGYSLEVRQRAIPSVTCYEKGGYVGGTRLFHNNKPFARGPISGAGPQQEGTYAIDFGGFRQRLGRVFLAPSNDPSRGYPINWNYIAEGPRVTDIFAIRPFRKAVLEKHEDIEERKHGHEGHVEGGHAPEGGH